MDIDAINTLDDIARALRGQPGMYDSQWTDLGSQWDGISECRVRWCSETKILIIEKQLSALRYEVIETQIDVVKLADAVIEAGKLFTQFKRDAAEQAAKQADAAEAIAA